MTRPRVDEGDVSVPLPPSHESGLPSEHPLYRPRHSGRQRTALVSAAVFFCVPLLLLVVGVRPTELDNRRLVEFPGPGDGWGMFTGLPDWGADHLPLRTAGVRGADAVSRGVFGEPPPLDEAPAGAGIEVPFAPVDGSDEPTRVDPTRVVEGKDGWLYYGFDFEGKCRPIRPLDDVLGNLARLRSVVEDSGREFVLIVAPDKSTMVPQHLPDDLRDGDCARNASDTFWSRVAAETGALDLRPELQRIVQFDGSSPYYQLDTHWDDRGALLMVRRAAEAIQPGVTTTWKVEPKRVEEFEADLPRLLGRTGTNTVQVFAVAPDGSRDRTRPVHLDLTEPWRSETSPGTGVVRADVGFLVDSFATPATRYLPATFADVSVARTASLTDDGRDAALSMLVNQDAIVVEVVERELVFGGSPVLDPGIIDLIGSRLAANPR